MTTDKCRSCGAPVLWMKNRRTHKAAPIDTRPSPDGNVLAFGVCEGATDAVVWTGYSVLAGERLAQYRANGTPLRTSHFATCPNAATHRTKATPEPEQMEIA